MVAPSWRANGPTGGSFSAATTVTTGFPAGVEPNDIAILQIAISDNAPAYTWPAGFTQISVGAVGLFSCGVAWKRCDGSEDSTTVNTTLDSASTGTSRLLVFKDCQTTGTPYEGLGVSTGASTVVDSNAITTTAADRLGVHVIGYRRNAASTEPAGWVEHVDAGANIARCIFESRTISTATTEPATSRTILSADFHTVNFALLPVASIQFDIATLELDLAIPAPSTELAANPDALELALSLPPATSALIAQPSTLELELEVLPSSTGLFASPATIELLLELTVGETSIEAAPATLELELQLLGVTLSLPIVVQPATLELALQLLALAGAAVPYGVNEELLAVMRVEAADLGCRILRDETLYVRLVDERTALVRTLEVRNLTVVQGVQL